MRSHFVIKFASDLRQVGGFLRVFRFPPPNCRHDITEILLKVALNTINKTKPYDHDNDSFQILKTAMSENKKKKDLLHRCP